MEIFCRVIEVLEDYVCAVFHAGLCVDATWVGRLAYAERIVIDQFAGILCQGSSA